MQAPTHQRELRYEAINCVYVIHSYRQLSDDEAIAAVRFYRSRLTKTARNREKNKRIEFVTLIGLVNGT